MPRAPKQSRSKTQPGRNARGQFKRGFSGNRLGHPKKLSADSSVADLVAGMASTKRIAKALLRRATDGDPRALELVLTMLSRAQAANAPKNQPNYDLLTTPQLLVIRALSSKCHGELVSDTEVLEVLQSAVAELDPEESTNDEEEVEETSNEGEVPDGISDEEVKAYTGEIGKEAAPAGYGVDDAADPDLKSNQDRERREKDREAWEKLYGKNPGLDLPIARKPPLGYTN